MCLELVCEDSELRLVNRGECSKLSWVRKGMVQTFCEDCLCFVDRAS